MTGFLSKARHHHIHVFVDDASDLTYAHHTGSTDVSEAIEAKEACERETCKYGKEVRHMHADNGTHACEGYKDATHEKKQSLTCCGVGAHFQNGKAENRIKTMAASARTTLINGMHKWPGVVTPSLWPFSVSTSTRNRNKFKLDSNGTNAEERLSGIKLDKKNYSI